MILSHKIIRVQKLILTNYNATITTIQTENYILETQSYF